jgi:hypothetical protein
LLRHPVQPDGAGQVTLKKMGVAGLGVRGYVDAVVRERQGR